MAEELKSNRDRETVNASESFNYTNENNINPRENEFFVYHFEDNKNKLGFEDNKKETGKEVNTDVDAATEVTTEDLSTNTAKLTKAVSSTVQTAVVATTTTVTTVVAVVAGGAAVAEMSYIEPKFHEFDVVETVGNALSYTLLLGDDLEAIQNGEEKRSCNVVIELKLESYDQPVKTVKVENYGSVSGTFDSLEYSTNYTIRAIEYSFIDVAGWTPHLLDEKTITTEDEIPSITNDIGIRRLIDGYGDEYYCVTLTYDNESNYYSDFQLEIYSSNNELVYNPLSLDNTIEEQRIRLPEDFDNEATYRVDVTCLSTDPKDLIQGKRANEGESEGRRITLVSKTVDFATLPTEKEEPITTATLDIVAETNSYGEVEYFAWFYYADDIELESLFFGIYDPQEEQVGENYYLEYRQNARIKTPIDLPLEDMDTSWTYAIKVYRVVHSEEDPTGASSSGESALWFVTSFVLDEIEPTDAQYSAPTIGFKKHVTADYQVQYLASLAVFDDPEGRFYAYYFEFDDGIADVPFQIMINGTPSSQEQDFLLDYSGEFSGTYTIKGYRTFGRGQESVTSQFIVTEFDFDTIETTEEPITNNAFFYKKYRQNGENLMEVMLTSPNEDYYSNFEVTFYDVETKEEVTFASLSAIFKERQSLEIDMPSQDWMTEQYTVTITCESINPEDTGGDQTTSDPTRIDFFNQVVDFNEIPIETEQYVEPVISTVNFIKYKSLYDNELSCYFSVSVDDPCDFWTDYNIYFYSDSSYQQQVASFSFLKDEETNLSDIERISSLLSDTQTTFYYQINVYSTDPNNMSAAGPITIDNGSIIFGDIVPILDDRQAYIEYTLTENGKDESQNTLYSLSATLHFADMGKYENYILNFASDDGVTKTYQLGNFNGVAQLEEDAYSIFGEYTIYTVTLTADEKGGTYGVTLYKEKITFPDGQVKKPS